MSTKKTATVTEPTLSDVPTEPTEPTEPTTPGAPADVMPEPGAPVEAQPSTYSEARPTMVNGKYVGDKRYNEATGEWEPDPDAVAPAAAEDIFDRIGKAFPHESQRLVIEEIARWAGVNATAKQALPDDMPTGGKSTASMRSDNAQG